MRIKEIHIDGYGLYHDRRVEKIPSGLSLFLGKNEAGKSTLLSFIRSLFFGFPTGRSKENPYPPLSGGKHGGSITIIGADGRDYRIERYSGASGGKLTVYLPDGSNGYAEDLDRLLLNTNRELYNNIYAFSLSELQAFESLRGEGIRNALYGASAGTRLTAIPDTQKYLRQNQADIFKPKGEKQFLNLKLSELKELLGNLSKAEEQVGEFDKLMDTLTSLENEIAEKRETVSLISSKKNHFLSLRELWGDWITYCDLGNELKKLPEVLESFPHGALEAFEQEKRLLKEREATLLRIESNREELAEELKNIPLRNEMLSLEGDLISLFDHKAFFEENLNGLPTEKDRLRFLENDIRDELANLGNDWSEEKVVGFDRSLATRDTVTRFRESLREKMLVREKVLETLAGKKADLDALKREEEAVLREMETIPAPSPSLSRDIVEALRDGKKHFVAVSDEVRDLKKEVAEQEKELSESIRNIDGSWTSETLVDFDISQPVRNQLEDFESEFEETEKVSSDALSRFQDAESQVRRLERELSRLEKESGEITAPVFSLVKTKVFETEKDVHEAIDVCRSLVRYQAKREKIENDLKLMEERIRDKNRRLEEVTDSTNNEKAEKQKITSLVFAIFGLAAIGFSLYIGSTAGLVFGAAFIVIAFLLYFLPSRNKEEKRENEENIIQEVHKLREDITQMEEARKETSEWIAGLQNTLGTGKVSVEEALRGEDELLKILVWFAEHRHRMREADRVRDDLAEHRKFLEIRLADMAEKEEALDKLREKWKNWLAERGLREELRTPKRCSLLFGRIESAKEKCKAIDALQKRIDGLNRERQDYCALLGNALGSPIASGEETEKIMNAVESLLLKFREEEECRKKREQMEDRLHGIEIRHKTLEDAVAKTEAARISALEAEQEERESWRKWLLERGFHPELSPETALEEGIRAIEKTAAKITDKEKRRMTIEAKEASVRKYLDLLASVAGKLGLDEPKTAEAVVLVRELEASFEVQKELRTRKKEKSLRLLELGEEFRQAEEQANEARMKIDEILSSAHSTDEGEFREKERLFSEAKRLREGMAALRKSLLTVSGEKDFEALQKELSGTDVQRLEAEEERNALLRSEAEKELGLLHDRKAELKHQVSFLTSSDELSSLCRKREELAEEIRHYAREWTRYAIAEHLVQEAKERFEKKEQPKVVLDSADYFREISAGKYSSVIAPVGEEEIYVETPDGKRRKGEELSRGTAEQLYLALRFGYIENFSSKRGALPIIMDDIFVNFDPERARESSRAVIKMAKSHQIFFFTCHPSTIEMFRNESDKVSLFTMEKGTITREK